VQPLNPRHFATLGLSVTATYDEVKRAYRLKARENHPDLHPRDKEKYTLRMAEINAAFEAISKRLKD
jgi:molecular chaperone DnaJ